MAGEVLTATKMNQIQSNISFIKSGVEDGTLIGEGVVLSDNINWSTINGDKAIMLGGKTIQWGAASVAGVPSGQQKSLDIVFPKAYTGTPCILTTVNLWAAGSPVVIAANPGKTGFKAVAYQEHGNTQNVAFSWLAIGPS